VADKAEKTERRERVAFELDRRRRLAVPALAGGVLYIMGAVTTTSALSGAPSVGLLQGIAPAIHGEKAAPTSPKVGVLQFISNHAGALIAGALMTAISVVALVLVLAFLHGATRYRRAQMFPATRALIVYGGLAYAIATLVHWLFYVVESKKFIESSDHSASAAEHALTGAAVQIVGAVAVFGGLFLAAGMVILMMNALRVGLIVRWLAILGMFVGLLIFIPIGGEQLQVVPALWLVFTGILFFGKWPGGDPPAWQAGEAVPWPPGGRRGQKAQQQERGSRRKGQAVPTPTPAPQAAADPQSAATVQASAPRKRRKRR